MPSTLGRNLRFCFTKMKSPMEIKPPPTNNLLSPPDTPILFKNYNSLYDHNIFEESQTHCSASSSTSNTNNKNYDNNNSSSSSPDLSTVFASQRFFFSSPGLSNSIIETAPSIATSTDQESSDRLGSSIKYHNLDSCNTISTAVQCKDQSSSIINKEESMGSRTVKDSVAVPTYSPDPYVDFRRSMQEMVEARNLVDVKANWDYLHELLLCYLALNPKSTHKFILGAFADLLVTLLSSTDNNNGGRREDHFDAGGCEISRQCM